MEKISYSHLFKMNDIFRHFREMEITLPAPNAQGVNLTIDEHKRLMALYKKKILERVQMQFIKYSLPSDIITHLNQHPPATCEELETTATNFLKKKEGKLYAMDDPTVQETDTIEAMQNKKPVQTNYRSNNFQKSQQQQQRKPSTQNYNKSNSYNSNSNNYKPNFNNKGNNQANNSGQKYCIYCKFNNHGQDECRRRIRDNPPCRTAAGKPYWPKKLNEVVPQEETSDIGISSTELDFQ